MRDLAVLIPARDEWLLGRTVQDILEHRQADTEVLVCLDGWEPGPGDTPIPQDPRVQVLRFRESVGQRVAVNTAARLTHARFILKVDAHCAFKPGFDVDLLTPYDTGELGFDVTSVPITGKLRAWEWVCEGCGVRTEQGPSLKACTSCAGTAHRREVVWVPRPDDRCDFGRFNPDYQFKYWLEYRKTSQYLAGGDFPELMCLGGGCWMMARGRYWQLGGLDESHGGWGQMGVEIAAKSWCSGGRQVVNQRTWYGHMFRTSKDFSFPYPLRGSDVEAAKAYSRSFWRSNRWPCLVRPASWIVEHFSPVPDWPAGKGH